MKTGHLNYLKEGLLNTHSGMASFLLQRVTGLGLVGYLILHLVSLSSIMGGEMKFQSALKMYDKPLFHFAEWLLLVAVVMHMFNGIRIVIVDWFGLTRHHRFLFWLGLSLSIIVAAVSIPFFFVWR